MAQTLLKSQTSNKSLGSLTEIEKKFKSREGYESYQIIDLDLNALTKSKNIEAYCFDSKIVVNETNKFVRNIKNYSWFGRSDDYKNSIMISVNKNDVQGLITKDDELYKIETINNNYVLIKVNQYELNKKDCGVDNSLDSEFLDFPSEKKKENNSFEKSAQNFSCKIRVLVMYTLNASANVSNMQGLAQLSIDQMNQTFINSEINAEVELVHVQLTIYSETNISPTSSATHDNDLTRFTTNGDGFMDEVHNLRSEYSADICVLICDIPESLGYAGIARSIKSSSQNSFCIVDYWYSFFNITFAHEIGHLIGCRHDESSDANNVPYQYGHGYTVNDPNGSWRTIMATTNSCNGCPRNPYWSNPNVSIPFGVTGTIATNDNARVINENIENVISHRPTNGTLVVNQSKTNAAMGGSLYNSNNIITDGSVVINSSQSLSMYAGHEIVLLPGFHAEAGSEFTAQIVPPCGTPDGLGSDYGLDADSINFNLKNSIEIDNKNYLIDYGKSKVSSIDIYPNPTKDEVNLIFELPDTNNELTINIVNYNGQVLNTIYKGNKEKGKHTLNYSISSLASGVYFVVVAINNTDIVSHKIVKQ
ncbi:MAG: hypothetical protein A2046_06565 [Bacteroidetes bacterium GWA2_30_7]|nr:MAG: hypothetical protein A2046_06565 [Bacteroidetes bacterium GWA2_30_7]